MSDSAEGRSVDDLLDLLRASDGAVRGGDERLQPFQRSGVLRTALEAGQVVQTPSTIQLPGMAPKAGPLFSLVAGLLAALVCLTVIGESLNWWNVFPENRRRGDWRVPPHDASREPLPLPPAPTVP